LEGDMRRLVYRNIFGNNPRKHEVSIEETSNRLKSKVSRKIISKYFIREQYNAENIEDVEQWIRLNKAGDRPKNCHVLTTTDSNTGECKIICKVMGTFYVVYELTALKIVYINEVKIQTLSGKKVEK
jgi:hypothetical protein